MPIQMPINTEGTINIIEVATIQNNVKFTAIIISTKKAINITTIHSF